MRQIESITILLAALFFASIVSAGGCDRTNWRGPEHDLAFEQVRLLDFNLAAEPEVLWQRNVGVGFASFVRQGERLYTVGSDADPNRPHDTLYCLNADTGDVLWRRSYPASLWDVQHEGGPAATPVLDAGRVYTWTRDGELYGFDAATGKRLLHRDLHERFGYTGRVTRPPRDYGMSGTPLILDGRIVLEPGGKDASAAALDKHTGEVLWHAGNDGPGYGSATPFTADSQRLLAIFNQQALAIHRFSDGEILARQSWPTNIGLNAASPLVIDGNRIVVSSYGMGAAMYEYGGGKLTELWKTDDLNCEFQTPVHHGGRLYGLNVPNDLVCLDAATGRTLWEQSNIVRGAVTRSGDVLVVVTERGEMIFVRPDPERYVEIARHKIAPGRCWTTPLLCPTGRIYYRNAKGEVLCLKWKKK